MNNKVLVKIKSVSTAEGYDLFIPVNEYIWRIKKLMIKSIFNISNSDSLASEVYILVNTDTGEIYDDNSIVLNTNIRNGSELLLLNIK